MLSTATFFSIPHSWSPQSMQLFKFWQDVHIFGASTCHPFCLPLSDIPWGLSPISLAPIGRTIGPENIH